jgi:hypothetical protein
VHCKTNPRMMHAPWVLLACLPHLLQANGTHCHGQHGVRLGNFLQRLIRAEGIRCHRQHPIRLRNFLQRLLRDKGFHCQRQHRIRLGLVLQSLLLSLAYNAWLPLSIFGGFGSVPYLSTIRLHLLLKSISAGSLTTDNKYGTPNQIYPVLALFVFEWLPLMASLVFVSLLAQVYLWFWCLGAVVRTENAFQTHFRYAYEIR